MFLRNIQKIPFFILIVLFLNLGACSQGTQNPNLNTEQKTGLSDSHVSATDTKISCDDPSLKNSKLCSWVMTEEIRPGTIGKITYSYYQDGRIAQKNIFDGTNKLTRSAQYEYDVTDPLFPNNTGKLDRIKELQFLDANDIPDITTYSYISNDQNGRKNNQINKTTFQDFSAGGGEEKEVWAWNYPQPSKVEEEYTHFKTDSLGATRVINEYKKNGYVNNAGLTTNSLNQSKKVFINDATSLITIEFFAEKESISYNGDGSVNNDTREKYGCGDIQYTPPAAIPPSPACPVPGNAADSTKRDSYTYDKEGKKLSKITEFYDPNTSVWSQGLVCKYDRDSVGYIKSETCNNPSDPTIPESVTLYTFKYLWEAAGLSGPNA